MHELMRTRKVDNLVSYSQSFSLKAPQIRDFERELIANPNNLEVRAKLIGHYSGLRRRSTKATESLTQHIEWFVEHCPQAAVACDCSQRLEPADYPNHYRKLDLLWKEKIKEDPSNFQILFNAVVFYETMGASKDALEIAQRAQKLRSDRILAAKIRYLKDILNPAGDWQKFKKAEIERLRSSAKENHV